jgi:Putative Flp pilus-assembly TadE/G-like
MTLWILGLTIIIIGFGGVALDFWRGLATQRELAAIADAATTAAASGIDELHYRLTGEVILDAERSRALGAGSLASQGKDLDFVSFTVASDGSAVEIVVVDSIEAGFIGFFTREDGRLVIRATSSASPRLIP